MALALILALEHQPDGLRVRYDVGKNRYLSWQLGEEETVTRNGLPSMANAKERSPMIGPLRPEARGRGEFLVPRELLDRDRRWLQIFSYRDRGGNGPAISAVAEIPAGELLRTSADLPPPAGFALSMPLPMSLQLNKAKENTMTAVSFSYAQQVDNAPFNLRERRLSRPMFWEAIIGALPSLIPMLMPTIGQVAGPLLRSSSGAGGSASDTGAQAAVSQIANLAEQVLRAIGPAAQQILTPDNMRQIMQLIQAGTGAGAARAPVSSVPAGGAAARSLSNYSQAQVAPALLAALPALMPLLQQVLSPQTVQAVLDAPQKMTGQIINGITDFAKLGLQADQQLQEHLRALNPGVDDPALHQLLAGMSFGLSARRTRNYKRVASVRIQLDDVKTQVVMGREVALYQHGAALQFPVSVETSQAINDAEVMVQIKQADNLRIVHEASEPVGTVSNGPLELIPRIEANVTQSLAAQKDYIVILTLLWRNKKGQQRGTSIQHTVSLMSQYRFDRVEESGDLIPFSDREAYRDYWHQIWEAPFDKETRRVDIQTRYYLTLNRERNRNARIDSDIRSEQNGPRNNIRLRSGYEYSLFALNHLMSRLDPDQSPLKDEVLSALSTDDFVERFNQAAQHQGTMQGRPGEVGSIWVFPEFKIQTLVLVRAESVDENGNIGGLAEERARFPMPALIHFVGVKQS
jgi:hypothetical protein